MSDVPASARVQAPPRDHYRVFRAIGTRWMDNDVYGHVNNVVYYSWFDTAVNAHLIEQGALDIHHGAVIGLVVETHCNYFAPLAFPQTVQAGIRVALDYHARWQRLARGSATGAQEVRWHNAAP